MIVALLAQATNPLTQSEFDLPENIAFAIIAALMLYSALKMVTTGNVVHAALYLVIVLAGVAALFILVGSDFVGATQVLVYIGAIIVLFLFGIMLTKARLGDDESVDSEHRTMGALVGVLLLVVMAFALIDTFENEAIEFSDPEPIAYVPTQVRKSELPTPVVEALPAISELGNDVRVIISEDDFRALPVSVQRRVPGAEVFGNNKQIADAVFSQYIVAFEAVSVLLLAALIGAVVVARKE
ncbi:MAG: NADH-quinone oxidoreductase subunit J family protein [Acidimicrobiales bacterium]